MFHLLQAQLACQHHYIGKERVKPDRLHIGHIHLGRDVDLHACLTGIGYNRLISGYDGGYSTFFSLVYYCFYEGKVMIVYDRVKGNIRSDPMPPAYFSDLRQIFQGKIYRRPCPHIELLHPKINRISACLNCRH